MNEHVKKSRFQSSLKATTLADLLSPEELEELSKLGSDPPKKRLSLKMSRKDFECVLPLDPRHKSGGYRAYRTKSLTENSSAIQESLLWNAIFGNKSFRVIDWLLLFNYLTRNLINDKPASALMAILRITAGGNPSDLESFESSLYSVRQIAANILGKELAIKLCQVIQKSLGVKLPTSVEKLDKLLEVKVISIRPKRSPDPARIGVGYKDKGTLSKTPKEEPLDGDWIEPVEDCFLQLIKGSQFCRAFDSAFDKKKRKKLISQLIHSLENKD